MLIKTFLVTRSEIYADLSMQAVHPPTFRIQIEEDIYCSSIFRIQSEIEIDRSTSSTVSFTLINLY